MKYCKICLESNTRPQTRFDKDQICPACKYHISLKNVSWENRLEELKHILKYKKTSNYYDCVLGVSGGKDSTRQALWLRDKAKLNPLLVCLTYPPEQVTERGCHNLSNLINLGFDVIVESLPPVTWKKLMKSCFIDNANFIRASEQALKASAIKIAMKNKLNIIFWGENSALQLGDLKTGKKLGWDGNNNRYTNTLKGADLNWILNLGYKKKDVFPYEYPSKREFKKNKLQIIYMGWFLADWGLLKNGYYSCLEGLEIRDDKPENTGDLYGTTSLDEDWVTLNQMIKYYKYGFGRATEYINLEIREKKISRDKAIKYVEKYDGKCSSKYIKSFCKYIDISKKDFWKKVYSVTNKKLFKISRTGKIIKKFKVGKDLKSIA